MKKLPLILLAAALMVSFQTARAETARSNALELIEQTQESLESKIENEIKEQGQALERKIKQSAKDQIRSFGIGVLDWLKQFALNPLKTKIQQGSDWVRNKINEVKGQIFN